MNKSRIVGTFGRESVMAVVLHGRKQMQKGKFPSMAFMNIKNPKQAFAKAELMLKALEDGSPIPEIDGAAHVAAETAEAAAQPVMMTIVIRYEKHMNAAREFGRIHFPGGFDVLIISSPRAHIEAQPNKEDFVYYDPNKT